VSATFSTAVAHHDDLGRAAASQAVERKGERAPEIGARVAGADARESALQLRGVFGHGRERGDARVHLRDEHAISESEPLDQAARRLLGSVEPGGSDVRGLHGRARVDEHDQVTRFAETRGQPRIAEREHEQG
jgi:hypothetical protein